MSLSIPSKTITPTHLNISSAPAKELRERKLPPPLPNPASNMTTLANPAQTTRPISSARSSSSSETKASPVDKWAQDIARITAIAAAQNFRITRPTEGWVAGPCKNRLQVDMWRDSSEVYRIGSHCIHFVYQDPNNLQELADLGHCIFLTTDLHFDSKKGLGLDNATLDALMSAIFALVRALNQLENDPFNFNHLQPLVNAFENTFGQQIWTQVIATLKKDPKHIVLAKQLDMFMNSTSSEFAIAPILPTDLCHATKLFLKTCLEIPVFDFEAAMHVNGRIFRKTLSKLLGVVSLSSPPMKTINETLMKLRSEAIKMHCKICAFNLLKHLPHFVQAAKPIFCFIPLVNKEHFKKALNDAIRSVKNDEV